MADDLWFSTHYLPQLRIDEWLWGGIAPTVWFQDRLWHDPAHLQWYDYASWFVYVSYFLSTYILAAALWIFALSAYWVVSKVADRLEERRAQAALEPAT
jgi:hypothetical protein